MSYEVRPIPVYSENDVWVKVLGNGNIVIGITDYAQQMLKEVTYVDMPCEGDTVTAGESFASAESIKAVAEIISPVNGTITAVNESVMDDPGMVNQSPYDEGWLIEVEPYDWDLDKQALMNADEYRTKIENEK